MPPSAAAQLPGGADDAAREQAFVEALRREDAAVADRYVALRDARAQAIAELRKVEAQYNAAGPELRGLFVRGLVQARKKYAETSLALLVRAQFLVDAVSFSKVKGLPFRVSELVNKIKEHL